MNKEKKEKVVSARNRLLLGQPDMLRHVGCNRLVLLVVDTSYPMQAYVDWLVRLANSFRARVSAVVPTAFYGVATFNSRMHALRSVGPINDQHKDLRGLVCEGSSHLYGSVQEVLEKVLESVEDARKHGHRLSVVVYVLSDGHDWGSLAHRTSLRQTAMRCTELGVTLVAVGCGFDSEKLARDLEFPRYAGPIRHSEDIEPTMERLVAMAFQKFLSGVPQRGRR